MAPIEGQNAHDLLLQLMSVIFTINIFTFFQKYNRCQNLKNVK